MTTGLHVKHTFVSAKADGADNTIVQPSDWNDEHTLVMDSAKILGRQTASNGAVEQLDCTAAAASLLSQADIAAMLSYLGVSPFTTGDGKFTLKTSADSGWVMMDDGTIGNASSSATTRANADTSALFTLLYALADADAPLLTSVGGATTRAAQGSAATAFANNCRMTLPKQLGRALVVAGAGSGLTSRVLGSTFGAETHTLTRANLPQTSVSVTITDPGHFHTTSAPSYSVNQWNPGGGAAAACDGSTTGYTSDTKTTGITAAFNLNGNVTQTTASIVQASAAWNVMVKL